MFTRPKSKAGNVVSLSGLRKYAADHEFLKHVTCFCSLVIGTDVPVKLFTVHKHDSEHVGDQCLGCKYWDSGKEGVGCKYFGACTIYSLHAITDLWNTVNITRLFQDYPPQDTFQYQEYTASQKGMYRVSLHCHYNELTISVTAEKKRLQSAQRRAGKFI